MCQRCMRTTTHGGGHIGTSDTLNGCVEIIESLALDDLRADLAADTEAREAALNSHKSNTRRSKAFIVSNEYF